MPAHLRYIPAYFLRPLRLIQTYDRSYLQPDLIAGLTVAIVLLPQAIVNALIAELPPQVGLYTAIVAAIAGALWGCSNHLQTGPTNAASLLVLSIILPMAAPGSQEFLVAAGLMAVMVGLFRLTMGLARLGMLVNFVSDSVIVGFTAGAGVLISVNQLRHLLQLDFPSSPSLSHTVQNIVSHVPETHWPSLGLGLGTILLIVLLRLANGKLPGPLIGMVVAAVVVWLLQLDQHGVKVIGELPRNLPPLARPPLLDLELIGQLSTGALAVAAIGLVEAMSIARAIAGQTGQRLDSNQEFVGQGLANIACGFLSGYPCSGSFTRSAVNYRAGGQTPWASAFSGLFVLVAMMALAPLARYVPRTALAGVLILTAYDMIDRREMVRIWRGTRGDAAIMLVTFLATLLLPLQFAVLTGILMSLAYYILKTSGPQVHSVLPDDDFRHLAHRPEKPQCPQLGILDIHGDLYFGAAHHVEEAIHQHMTHHPDQRFLLLRMHGVNLCDFTGIHMLESMVHTCREQGGHVFMTRVRRPVLRFMKSTGFYEHLGADHFLASDDAEAIEYLFYQILDPAICIYECDVRTFEMCQNLPKRALPADIIPPHTDIPTHRVPDMSPETLWRQVHGDAPPLIIDVREPREFTRGHIAEAQLISLPELLSNTSELPRDHPVVLVCRGGRRSTRAACMLQDNGYDNVAVLRGGMLAWEAADLLEALE